MISIICPSNNEKILNDYLISSLKEQTFKDYELIVVDSKKLGFNSASQALNYGASKARGDLLVFCHHDIQLLDKNLLEKLDKFNKKYDFDVGGSQV